MTKPTVSESLALGYRQEALAYRKFIADMAAFIRFAVSADRDEIITTTLVHDIMGVSREGLQGLFLPRVDGYADEFAPETTREAAML